MNAKRRKQNALRRAYGNESPDWFDSSPARRRLREVLDGADIDDNELDNLLWAVMPSWMRPAIPLNCRTIDALQRENDRLRAESAMLQRVTAAQEGRRHGC